MRRQRLIVVAATAALVLLGVRAALPELLAHYVNRVLDRSENFEGHIDDVDLALWRGGYAIEALVLDHREKEELRPLVRAERVDLSLEWGALLRGELVGEVYADHVVYNVVAAPPADDDLLAQTGSKPDLAERLSELFPFSIDRFEVRHGELHYRDPFRSPPVDIALRRVHLLGVNWRNTRHVDADRFGRAWLRAEAFESARLAASLEADPLARPPEFRFAGVSEGIDLRELNDFLKAYGGFDVEDGSLSLYVEVESRQGRYEGYVKPLVRDLAVIGDEGESWMDRIWEGVVGVVAEVFENQAAGRQATRIPLEGSWGDASPDLVTAVGQVIYNAFVEALPPRLEHPERLVERRDASEGSRAGGG